MTEAIVIRSNHYDLMLDQVIRQLVVQTGRRVVVAVDETRNVVKCPPDITKISVTPAEQGLYTTHDAMWRCGDYFLYRALEALPDATRFWLIEPDVRIHAADVRSFFDGTEATLHTDFVTGWFTPATSQWMWYHTMSPYTPKVFHCMMQISRFSRGAVEHLLRRRQTLSKLFAAEAIDPTTWPNDEAFVAASLVEAGFSVATLKEHAPGYQTSGTLMFTRPTSARWLAALDFNQHIYHPVVTGPKFLERANAYLEEQASTARDPAHLVHKLGNDFLKQIRIECGPQAAETFHQKIKDAAICSKRAAAHNNAHEN